MSKPAPNSDLKYVLLPTAASLAFEAGLHHCVPAGGGGGGGVVQSSGKDLWAGVEVVLRNADNHSLSFLRSLLLGSEVDKFSKF